VGGFHCPNSSCSLKLCSVCCSSHASLTCAEYQSTKRMFKGEIVDSQFIELIAREGFSQCNSCSMHVELESGCFHMTCNCTHQFCYLCKKRWKTCQCPQWDETRLTLRAKENLGDRANAVAIEAEKRNIQNAEECVNHSWRRINCRGMSCGNCGFYMYVYKFQCTDCHFNVCNMCQFNVFITIDWGSYNLSDGLIHPIIYFTLFTSILAYKYSHFDEHHAVAVMFCDSLIT